MLQLECLKLFEWERDSHMLAASAQFHASAEARLAFVTHWGAVFPNLRTMYALDTVQMERVDGRWTLVPYDYM